MIRQEQPRYGRESISHPRLDVEILVGAKAASVVEDISWHERAACRYKDPELFYQTGNDAREAKNVCGTCPVRAECLTYALETKEEWGVWGGMEEKERRKVVARLARRR